MTPKTPINPMSFMNYALRDSPRTVSCLPIPLLLPDLLPHLSPVCMCVCECVWYRASRSNASSAPSPSGNEVAPSAPSHPPPTRRALALALVLVPGLATRAMPVQVAAPVDAPPSST